MKKAVLKSFKQYNFLRNKVLNKIQPPIIVLMYHRVLPDNKEHSPFVVTVENFKKQINYLRNNFTLLSFDDDWNKISSPSFVITFDDGYYDNYLIAQDFLAKESVPSTFFISTKNIGTNDLFWWDELSLNKDTFKQHCDLNYDQITRKLIRSTPQQQNLFLSQYRPYYKDCSKEPFSKHRSMTRQELYELSQLAQVTIGTHTINHTRLPLLSRNEIEHELTESKTIIEGIIGKEITTCSFPYGSYNRETLKACRKAGIIKAATTVSRNAYSWTNPLMIPRIQIKDEHIEIFKKKIGRLVH